MAKKDIAEKRGNRAKKLFAPGTTYMNDVIAALEAEDMHRADPTNPLKPSGKPAFVDACLKVIKKADFNDPGPPPVIGTDTDVHVFIEDLWDATWGSRGAHEAKPCW